MIIILYQWFINHYVPRFSFFYLNYYSVPQIWIQLFHESMHWLKKFKDPKCENFKSINKVQNTPW